MNVFSSFHTHTCFCDGKNTPREMVEQAVALGCPSIGFTGHSWTPFDPGYCMDALRERQYQQQVLELKQEYSDRISVHLGLEQDYFSPPPQKNYEYLIGSVHYVKKNGKFLSIDDTPELLRKGIEELYGGDPYSLCEDYFALAAQVPDKTHCQIVGHFDLITKFNAHGEFFDEKNPRYRKVALSALDRLLAQGALLEINTGAVARGYRKEPYPAPWLLQEMGRQGAEAVITSDAHQAQNLLFGMEQAAESALKCGIRVIDFRTKL